MNELDPRLKRSELEPKTQIFQVKDFSYQYPESNGFGLKDLSFEVHQGEVLGIAGESGCGKTTLLHCLSGFIPHFFRDGQYAGEINFLGKPVMQTDLLEITRQQGVVFQDPSTQLFGMGVEDAIAFGMENIGLPREEMVRRIDQVLKSLQIEHLRKRQTLTLSGGERQAVAIASMLAMEPKVVLFDETISALDPNGQKLVRDILHLLSNQGMTMVVVDTDFGWLASVTNKVLVLNGGKLIFAGEPREILPNQELARLAGIVNSNRIEFRKSLNSSSIAVLDKVSFSYDGHLAVDDVSCKIKEGACTGIIGHNGSGKTTLAKLAAGLYKPSAGEIKLADEDIGSLPAEKAIQKVGYLYQLPAAMFMCPIVGKEVSFTQDNLGIGQSVNLEDFGLAGYEQASPYELSAGQQQRLALACLLSADPEILILDEPTLGQSQQDRQKLTQLIFQLQDKGKTVVLISHDWPMIARTTNEVLVMDHGRLVRQGPTREVLQDRDFFDQLGLPLPWYKGENYVKYRSTRKNS